MRLPVEDGPRAQAALDGPPAALHAHELLVAEGEIRGGEGVVIGGHDPLAVELLLGVNRGAIDLERAAAGLAQVPREARRGEQLAGSLRVALATLRLAERSELAP